MPRGLWNMDHASFFSEATLIEIGVYQRWRVHAITYTCNKVLEIMKTAKKAISPDNVKSLKLANKRSFPKKKQNT